MSSYLERTGMETPTVWATEVELFAAATTLNTMIYTDAPAGPVYKWLKLLPKGGIINGKYSVEAVLGLLGLNASATARVISRR